MYKILFLSMGAFALGVDAYIMAGLLPGIASSFAVSSSGAGQTVTIFTVCYAVSAPIFGALTAGKPVRWTLAAALTLFSLANACSALADSFPLLLASRAVAGLGAGLYTPLAVSAAAALVSVDRRGRALGLIVGGLAMGTAVGVPFGLVLAEHVGWRGTLWLVTALGGLALTSIIVGLPAIAVKSPPSLRERIAILGDRRITAAVGISFLTAVGTIGLYTYVALLFHAVGGVDNVLPYFWAWSLGGLVGIYVVGHLIDRTGRPEAVMASMLAALVIALAALTMTLREHGETIACFLLWGAAAWGAQAPQQHRLLSLQPEHGSTAVALHSSAHYLGSAVGAALGGVAMTAGMNVTALPWLATAVLALALTGQMVIVLGGPTRRRPSMLEERRAESPSA